MRRCKPLSFVFGTDKPSELQHFQPTLQFSPGALYFPSLAQIDLRHDESTAEESQTIYVDSNQQHFQPTLHSPRALYFLSLAQIDFRHNDSTARETILVDFIKEGSHVSRIANTKDESTLFGCVGQPSVKKPRMLVLGPGIEMDKTQSVTYSTDLELSK